MREKVWGRKERKREGKRENMEKEIMRGGERNHRWQKDEKRVDKKENKGKKESG